VFLVGKIVIVLSVMEYRDYKRAFRGEDLSGDSWISKKLRDLRRKYYH